LVSAKPFRLPLAKAATISPRATILSTVILAGFTSLGISRGKSHRALLANIPVSSESFSVFPQADGVFSLAAFLFPKPTNTALEPRGKTCAARLLVEIPVVFGGENKW